MIRARQTTHGVHHILHAALRNYNHAFLAGRNNIPGLHDDATATHRHIDFARPGFGTRIGGNGRRVNWKSGLLCLFDFAVRAIDDQPGQALVVARVFEKLKSSQAPLPEALRVYHQHVAGLHQR